MANMVGGGERFISGRVLFGWANGLVWKLWAKIVPPVDSGEDDADKTDK